MLAVEISCVEENFSQYFRRVFIITRMAIGAVHEVQLAVEGKEDLLCLTHVSPGWKDFVIFIRNFGVSEFGLQKTQNLRFRISRQKL